jgi:hypothetical protein
MAGGHLPGVAGCPSAPQNPGSCAAWEKSGLQAAYAYHGHCMQPADATGRVVAWRPANLAACDSTWAPSLC